METLQALTTRTSCKSYDGRHIEKEILDQIVAAGLNAPSGMNLQSPYLIVISDEEVVAQLSKLNAAVMNAAIDPFYGAKDVIAVVVKKVPTGIYDGSLVMGNLQNAAWALGVGSCWIHRGKEVFAGEAGQALLKKWGILEDVEGIGFCVLGYAKEQKAKTVIKDGRAIYVS